MESLGVDDFLFVFFGVVAVVIIIAVVVDDDVWTVDGICGTDEEESRSISFFILRNPRQSM